MRPKDAEVMRRYVLGKATKKDFNEALMDSLRDPRWMMKWFTTQHALSSPIANIVRKLGRELGQAMRSLAEFSAQWAMTLLAADPDTNPTGKRGEITLRLQEMEERQIIAMTQRMTSAIGIELGDFATGDFNTHCPGISAGSRSIYSSAWANGGGGRREEISDSQPVDALHALYAPYVQVFRADRFMAPHIQKQVGSAGTMVVPRLSQLVEENIEKQLR